MWIRGPLNYVCRRFDSKRSWFKGLCTCLTENGSVPALPKANRLTVLQAVDLWTKTFEQRDVSEPQLSSQHIISHLLGAKTLESLGKDRLGELLTQEQTAQIWDLCNKRLTRMPVQYVIEEWDFRDLTLKMRPPVFIPRPETEELVGLVLADFQKGHMTGVSAKAGYRCLEVGCGSGAISLSLLKSLPQVRAFALDQSQDAVSLTRENAHCLGLSGRLEVYHMDVMKEDMTSLEPEILRFEDQAALDGGRDGMQVIRHILAIAPKLLSNHGRVYLEVDPRHPALIQRWVEENVHGLQYVSTQPDITNRPRFCILQKEEGSAGLKKEQG
ncbi:MTRF1L release factor glutamine methyltransferase isoform X3 [Osmerus eperlanus]|uniref:MTRF1L release factor glutamine methyltransferase isoform X3 n=1 Tax=Osmerus eperlanus TaxID=29151 RepID=UPI002E12BF66